MDMPSTQPRTQRHRSPSPRQYASLLRLFPCLERRVKQYDQKERKKLKQNNPNFNPNPNFPTPDPLTLLPLSYTFFPRGPIPSDSPREDLIQ